MSAIARAGASTRRAAEFPLAVRAVALDLDGTLLDTIGELATAVNLTLEELGLPELPLALVRAFVGKGIATLVTRSLAASRGARAGAFGGIDVGNVPDAGIASLVARTLEAAQAHAPTQAELERAQSIYMERYASVLNTQARPFPRVIEGLERLSADGFGLAVVTNKASRFTHALLEGQGLASYFDLVICGDTLPKRKPDPLPLTYTAAHFGTAPAELLMVGDSRNDTTAARAAGSPVLCVPYGYNEGEPVESLDCDGIVETVADAAELLMLA